MKKILISLIFIPSIILGQIEFEKKTIIDESNSTQFPKTVFSIDLDGDGFNDLITGASNKLVWQKNLDGLGNFGPLINIDSSGFSTFSIDIDNDNDNDIVSILVDNIKIYKNNGSGEFNENFIITNSIDRFYYSTSSSSIYPSDIDGDGLLDIVSFSNENAFVWFKNIDGSNFSDSQIISSVYKPNYVFSDDIDNDGDMDIIGVFKEVVSSGGSDSSIYNRIKWFENTNGIGTNWIQRPITTQYIITERLVSPLTIDIDNDGDLDIVYGKNDYDNSRLIVKKNNGNGVFDEQQYLTVPINMISDICITDINNDNLLDIVTSSGDWVKKVFWYENLGSGNFSSQNEIDRDIETPSSVISSDLNNDGKTDIIYSSSSNHEVYWNENLDAQGSFAIKQSTMIISNYPVFALSLDIDNDGDLDVFSLSNSKLAWHENLDGNGNFGLQKTIYIGRNYTKMIAIDVDNDNDEDFIVCGSNYISLFKNIDGEFNEQILRFQYDVNSLSKADFDNDGDFDIVATSSSKITWFENLDGLGTFGTEQIISSNAANSSFCIDLDNDGDFDIVTCSRWDNSIKWFKNTDGLGNFDSGQIISTIENPTAIAFSDIDDDGDLDLLSASKSDHKLVWYENTDNLGNFGTEQIISSDYENQINDLKVIDIDNDGVNEILTNAYQYIHVFKKDNNFGDYSRQRVDLNPNYYIKNIHPADLDNDGDIDIISCISRHNLITWYKNLNLLGNKINGNIKLNFNNNGCDVSNILVPNLLIETNTGTDSFATFTQNNGDYLLHTNEGDFTTTATLNLPNYFTVNPNSQTNTFTGYNNTFTADFCIEPNQTVNDINISFIPTSESRPGFNTSYRIVYNNVGTTPLNGSIILNFDDTKLSLLSASETVSIQTNTTLTFNYTNLNPFETRIIDLKFNIFTPPTVNINDILNFTVTANPIVGDYTTSDNIYTLNQTVIGSYDPNDITCLEGDEILLADTNKFLHYVIRFQNSGTASAINVLVQNVLDTKLDWSTLQLETTSHNSRIAIKNGNEVEFIFKNINLPDENTDEPNSHGFIAYKIKPKGDIAVGDIIQNKADIFFDFNAPIETNTVTTQVTNVLSINHNKILNFSISPTPTKNILTIKSKTEIVKIEIYSNLGQLILKNTIDNEVNISDLAQGIYFAKVEDINGTYGIKKVIKK